MLKAVCSLTFHLTEGQELDAIYPKAVLTDEEIAAVKFHAFPDSMSFELTTRSSIRDTSFHFRIPRSQRRQGFLTGYVFCRQRQVESLRRGGEQRSVVLLTSVPLSSIFIPLSRQAGPLCLSQGPGSLRLLYERVFDWATTTINWSEPRLVEFPLLGPHSLIRTEIISLSSLSNDSITVVLSENESISLSDDLDDQTGLPPAILLALAPTTSGLGLPTIGIEDIDVFTPFNTCIRNLWTLWEILILGEPLLIAAPSPSTASSACSALLSLMHPIPYNCDYRPYFTIHDPAFGPLSSGIMPNENSSSASLPVLVGVTNPFIIQSLAHWPNIVSTGFTSSTAEIIESIKLVQQRSYSIGGFLQRKKSTPQTLQTNPIDTMWLSYRPHIRPDNDLIRELTNFDPGDGAARRNRCARTNSNLIRRHFAQLNTAIVSLLLKYIQPLKSPSLAMMMNSVETKRPPDGHFATPSSPPPLPELPSPVQFSSDIQSGKISIPESLLKIFGNLRNLAQFYQKLLESSGMQRWLEVRRRAAHEFQSTMWRAAWHEGGGPYLLPGVEYAEEVGDMEVYLELETQLKRTGLKDDEVTENVRRKARDAFDRLPEDVREALMMSPERSSFLNL